MSQLPGFTFEGAYDKALSGDLGDLRQAMDAARSHPDPGAQAWAAALEAVHALVVAEDPASVPRDLRSTSSSGGDAERALVRACLHRVMGAFLRFDGPAVRAWGDALEAVSPRAGPVGERSALFADGWASFLAGELDRAAELATHAESLAKSSSDAPQVVEAAALGAVVALAKGDLEAARSLARRASRMARTETLLFQEYLANTILARVRRHEGRPYLATRILTELGRVVPRPWRAWVAWEMVLAGGALPEGWSPDAPLAATLEGLRVAAACGDAMGFERSHRQLRSMLSGAEPFAREAVALCSMLDVRVPLAPDGPAQRWAVGEDAEPPLGIQDQVQGGSTTAFVYVTVGHEPRRVSRSGLALLGPEVIRSGQRAGREDGRQFVALSVLAFAGRGGLTVPELFQCTYGFAYDPVRHGGVFRVLLHRARELVSGAAEILREGERVALHPVTSLSLPDPRCELPLQERVLQMVAAGSGRLTAQTAARQLGVSVRAVQRTLRGLVDEGTCSAERHGRKVEYVVEDTTFYEPSLRRLNARPDG